MEKENELTAEQKADLQLVGIINVICDIMDGKELGTTQNGNERFGQIIPELAEQTKLRWGNITSEQANLNAAMACYGYGSFGIEFIEKLMKDKEFTKTILVSLIEAATNESAEAADEKE